MRWQTTILFGILCFISLCSFSTVEEDTSVGATTVTGTQTEATTAELSAEAATTSKVSSADNATAAAITTEASSGTTTIEAATTSAITTEATTDAATIAATTTDATTAAVTTIAAVKCAEVTTAVATTANATVVAATTANAITNAPTTANGTTATTADATIVAATSAESTTAAARCVEVTSAAATTAGATTAAVNTTNATTASATTAAATTAKVPTTTTAEATPAEAICPADANGCAQICVNLQGEFHCACIDGFNLTSDGKNCTTNDPCNAGNNCSQLCVKRTRVDTCVCNVGFRLDADGKTCSDVDMCASNTTMPCKGDSANYKCQNSPGSVQCVCTNGFKLSSDRVSCVDRDGGYINWFPWSACSLTCGGGVQSRSRLCTSPTPAGRGVPCTLLGPNMDTRACNRAQCPLSQDEKQFGVQFSFRGLKKNLWAAVDAPVRDVIKSNIDLTCNMNYGRCCTSGSRPWIDNITAVLPILPNSSFVHVGDGFPVQRNESSVLYLDLLMLVSVPLANELCAAGKAPTTTPSANSTSSITASRRKRGITLAASESGLPQSVLLSIINSPAIQTQVQAAILTSAQGLLTAQELADLTATLSVTQVALSLTASSAATTTNTSTTTTTVANLTIINLPPNNPNNPPKGDPLPMWAIAVIVLGCILVAIAVVAVVVAIIKRPPKVDPHNRHNRSVSDYPDDSTSHPLEVVPNNNRGRAGGEFTIW